MITLISSEVTASKKIDGTMKGRAVMTLAGLTADTKPTTYYKGVLIANGSVCIVMDAGTTYMYDEEGAQWHTL